jgi:hypothetical protein
MGRLLVLSFLFAAANAFAAVPGNAPILTIAAPGQQTQALSIPLSCLSSGGGCPGQVFSLFAGNNSMTGNDYYILYKNGVAYQVGASTKAYCVNSTAATTSASDGYQLFSATASFANGASSITGAVYQCGSPGLNCTPANSTTYVPYPVPGIFVFGSSTYAGMQPASSAGYFIHLDCYEQ